MLWLISQIDDDLKTGVLSDEQISVRSLRRGHPRSITDLHIAKLKMKSYLLTAVLDSKPIRSDCKAMIRHMLESIDTYRTQLRPLNEDHTVDTTFLTSRPRSATKFLSMVEGVVYLSSSMEEGAIRTGLKAGKQAEEILLYSPFSDWTTDLDTQLQSESNQKISGVDPPAGDKEENDDAKESKLTAPKKSGDNPEPEDSAELDNFTILR